MKFNYLFNITPRFSDTDSYGVMHHSSYYKWFEEARFMVSKELLGFDKDLLNGKEIKFPVVESYCRYKLPVTYGDILDINVTLTVHKSAKITFDYEVKNTQNNKICAIGKTVHMFTNSEGIICLNTPQWFLDRLNIKN